MAAPSKEYAYYLKGNKIAIVERDSSAYSGAEVLNSDGTGTGTYQRAHGESNRTDYKSPLADVADGLKIEYSYVPEYFIESTDVSTATVESWDQDNDGNFRLRAASGTDWTSSPNLSAVTHIVLKNAGKFNGLHKVSLVQSTRIVTTTTISASTSATLFEQTPTMYYDVQAFVDEDFNLDIPPYLEDAVVYYMKARLAEDAMQPDQREYFMSLFRKRIERHENSRQWGARIISSGPFAVR